MTIKKFIDVNLKQNIQAKKKKKIAQQQKLPVKLKIKLNLIN